MSVSRADMTVGDGAVTPADRPTISRSRSTPPRRHHDLPKLVPPEGGLKADLEQVHNKAMERSPMYNPNVSAFDFGAASSSAVSRRVRRGMTMDEVKRQGILDPEEGSGAFDDIQLEDADIKKLPKKLRPYYEHLAQLKEHYQEVDTILSGSLPYTVASSFAPAKGSSKVDGKPKTYTQLLANLEDDVARAAESDDGQAADEEWLRRVSTWNIKRANSHRQSNGGGHSHDGSTKPVEEDAGEETALLTGQEKEEERDRVAQVALYVNTAVNVGLVIAKVFAVLYSSSISLTASLVDSVLDLLSTFIILGTSWAIGAKTDRHLYPAGKRRFEPLGVLVFSVAMIASFVQVFIESFQRARGPADEHPVDLSTMGIVTMVATIGIKGVIWVWCSRIPSSGVQALAQDAENDVFFNLMSLAFPGIGSALHWRLLDPIGGMVLSTYIIVEWVKTLLENFRNLSGRSASPDQITRVLYLVTRFNPVLEIGDVECYHIGDDLLVEVDVILPKSSTLHFAHDVGETIQCCLESLDGVLRAYVHVDYSSANPAQHTTRTQHSASGGGSSNKLGLNGVPSSRTQSTDSLIST